MPRVYLLPERHIHARKQKHSINDLNTFLFISSNILFLLYYSGWKYVIHIYTWFFCFTLFNKKGSKKNSDVLVYFCLDITLDITLNIRWVFKQAFPLKFYFKEKSKRGYKKNLKTLFYSSVLLNLWYTRNI